MYIHVHVGALVQTFFVFSHFSLVVLFDLGVVHVMSVDVFSCYWDQLCIYTLAAGMKCQWIWLNCLGYLQSTVYLPVYMQN